MRVERETVRSNPITTRTQRSRADGRRLAAAIIDPRRSTNDLWVVDLERNVSTRLTSSPRWEMRPRWSPDGTRVVFSADWEGPPNLYVVDAGGGTARVLVPFDRTQQYAGGWTADARHVLYEKNNETFTSDIWIVDATTGDRRSLFVTEFNESWPVASPNGQWLAYVSDASGRQEIYLRSIPDGTSQTRLSTDGGRDPAWRSDGREIFYYEPSGAIMSVSIEPGPSGPGRPGLPVRLFPVDERRYQSFAVAPDGQRIPPQPRRTRRALATRRGDRRLDAADEEIAVDERRCLTAADTQRGAAARPCRL